MVNARRFYVPVGVMASPAPLSDPLTGDTYFDTTLGQLRSWDGTQWVGTSSDANLDGRYVDVVGDAMTGELEVPDQVAAPPSVPAAVSTKGYVDQLVTVSDAPPAAAPVRDGLVWAVAGKVFLDPRTIPGLTIWLDASQLPQAPGEAVDPWLDMSGNDLHGGVVHTPAPVLVDDVRNGYPAVRITAPYGRYRWTDTGVDKDFTVVYVARMSELLNQGRVFSAIYPTANTLFGWHLGSMDIMYAGDGFGEPGVNQTITTDWKMYSADGASAPVFVPRLFSNGVFLTGTTEKSQGLGGTMALSGYEADSSAEMTSCDVTELLLYNRKLDDTERQQVEGYLREKYGF
jgi:hypothetical protein